MAPGRVLRGTARATLLNILGEFALDSEAGTPTGALVSTMSLVGIGNHAARQSIQRCAATGWIDGLRTGRESRWRLTEAGRARLREGIARVEALAAPQPGWDGSWCILTLSIPHELRGTRRRLARALHWGGFGSPQPGVWVSTHRESIDPVAGQIERCGLTHAALAFIGSPARLGIPEAELVANAWDLAAIEDHYRGIDAATSEARSATPEDCLRSLLELDRELQPMPAVDPHLPDRLAPGWEGREIARLLLERRRRWKQPAERHWRALST